MRVTGKCPSYQRILKGQEVRQTGETENLVIEGWENEYKDFVDKFKHKKTTDDCYTPPEIYDAIAGWVEAEYGVDKACFLRPFYPGGDYERFNYPSGSVTVDNPPFSLISKIVAFYCERGIRFFLFAPALTIFQALKTRGCAALTVGVTITYQNGAEVPTSFLTNLEPRGVRVRTAPDLYRIVDKANKALLRKEKAEIQKYEYPDHVLTAAMAQRWCKYGVEYRLTENDCLLIQGLDSQFMVGKKIFGAGFLLSTEAAAERAAAERAAAKAWELSDRERYYIRRLDEQRERAGQVPKPSAHRLWGGDL